MSELTLVQGPELIELRKTVRTRVSLNPDCGWCTERRYCVSCARALVIYFAREFRNVDASALASPSWYLHQLGNEMDIIQAYELRMAVIVECKRLAAMIAPNAFEVLDGLSATEVATLVRPKRYRLAKSLQLMQWFYALPLGVQLVGYSLVCVVVMGCLWMAVWLLSMVVGA
jgi:hypothetical protein